MLLTTNTSHFSYFLTPSSCPVPPPPLIPLNSPHGECTCSLLHPIISLQVTPTTQSTLRVHSGQVYSFTVTPQILPCPLLFFSSGGIEFLSELCFKLTAFLLRIGHHYFFFFLSVLSPFFRFLRKESGDSQMLPDRTDEATKLCFRPEERKD